MWHKYNLEHSSDYLNDTNIPKKSHYFTPCGAVIAWTKFVKSESTTNILKFLEDVFPDEELRPDYISVANGSWVDWFKSSCFVVNGYHYTNHHSDDYLCRKWCNPAPQDGSAPNLLGGFESIMKCMTPSNFNWFIPSMIFYHTQQVIKQQNSQNFSIISEDFEYDDGLL
ncbi:hypothetical protein BDQ17DRAFT_1391018 [Cyathus striatus]|nr:hypothetical protein BDQ17DRAFT_1391018 [Cyathus striatus]